MLALAAYINRHAIAGAVQGALADMVADVVARMETITCLPVGEYMNRVKAFFSGQPAADNNNAAMYAD